MRGDQLAANYYGTPWAITEAKLAEIDGFVERILAGRELTEAELARFDRPEPELAAGRELSASGRYEIQDGVAILPLRGVISKRSSMISRFSGGASADDLRSGLAEAVADPGVAAIVIEVDSPGGRVAGTAEASDAIYNARGEKPIVAVVNEMMGSGATWIGSAADRVILASETSEVGSIGVLVVRRDVTAAEQAQGIKTHIFKAGATKDYGHPSRKVDAGERRETQAYVDDLHTAFLTAVARNRGLDVDELRERAGDAQMFLGQDAIEVGLADGFGSLDATLARLAADPGALTGGAREMPKETSTTTDTGNQATTTAASTAATSIDELREAFPELTKQLEADAVAAANQVNATAQNHLAGATAELRVGNLEFPPEKITEAEARGAQAEAKRQSDIRALCERAQMGDFAQTLIDDPHVTAGRASELILDKMLTAHTAPAEGEEAETMSGGAAAAKPDPDQALRDEYQANASRFGWGFTEDEYVASAKRTDADGTIPLLTKTQPSKN